jgi:hypothetical protein
LFCVRLAQADHKLTTLLLLPPRLLRQCVCTTGPSFGELSPIFSVLS